MLVENLKQIWPEWTIEKELGEGSFGVVYKAVRKDHNVESYAAIKVISIPQKQAEIDSLRSEGLDLNGTRTYLQGIVNDFVSEIQLMESLKGIQNIVSVEDYKVVEKTEGIGWDIYIRMELLTPFNTYVSDKKLTEADVIKLGTDICTALEVCSKRNIIHRDIKPENIFINDFGYFKLGDFGIARKLENMSGGLSQKGTWSYMAPEVANSTNYDARVDTYSLGLVLYKLLNGNRLPFLDSEKQLINPNDKRIAIERRIHGESLTAPCEASPSMSNLILRACAFNPDQRFATASDMKKALEAVSIGSYIAVPMDVDATIPARPAQKKVDVKQPETFGKKKANTPKIIAIIAAIAVVLVGAGILVPKILKNTEDNPAPVSDTETSEFHTSGNQTEKVDTSEDTVDYSQYNEQIAAIIEEADALAKVEDYEGAVKVIQNGLATYKGSDELFAKLDEYNTALTSQTNEKLKADAIANSEKQADDSDYKGAIATLDAALKQLGDDEELLLLKNTYVDKHVEATLSQVDALIEDKDYAGATTLLKEARSVSPDNQAVSKKEDEVEQAHVSAIIAEADVMAGKEDYEDAAKKIQVGLTIYSKSDELTKKLVEYNSALTRQKNEKIKADAIANSEKQANNSNYKAAITTLNEAIKKIGNDSELVSLKSTYSDKYVANVLNQVNTLVDNGDYDNAKKLLNDAVAVVPDNDMLNSKRNEVNQYKTILLDTLNPINGGFVWNQGKPEDVYQNDYSNINNYSILDPGYQGKDMYSQSAEYRVDEKYTELSFSVSPYSNIRPDASAYIQVYVNDVLRYTSDLIVRTTDLTSVVLDISDAKTLKIVVWRTSYGSILLTDVKLSYTPNYHSSIDNDYLSLSLLKPINGSIEWDNQHPTDSFGHCYNSAVNYTVLDPGYKGKGIYTQSAEYRVDEKYTELSFSVSPYSNIGSDASAYIQVYVNDVLRYTSDMIVRKTDLISVVLDISDAKTLKIVVWRTSYGSILLTDVKLTYTPNYHSSIDNDYLSLSLLKPINGSIEWDNQHPTDSFGHCYNSAVNYTVLDPGYQGKGKYVQSAEYNLAGKYKLFSFDVCTHEHIGENTQAIVKIYVDDVLVYTSPVVNNKTQAIEDIEINVAKARYLKLEIEYTSYVSIMLLNAKLFSA